MNWVQGWNDNWSYFLNYLIGTCQGMRRTRQMVFCLMPCSGGAATSSGGRKFSTGGQNDAPPRGRPPAVVRVTTRCPWTRRRPVEAAGHVSLSPARQCAGESPIYFDFALRSLDF